jgi:elongation factor 2 kinase
MDSRWQQLQTLKELFDRGFMSQEEFELRKKQLIDELTGTTASSSSATDPKPAERFALPNPIVVPHAPPDWRQIKPEKAIKFVFDWEKKSWSETILEVKFDSTPFSKGALRMVYYLLVGSLMI